MVRLFSTDWEWLVIWTFWSELWLSEDNQGEEIADNHWLLVTPVERMPHLSQGCQATNAYPFILMFPPRLESSHLSFWGLHSDLGDIRASYKLQRLSVPSYALRTNRFCSRITKFRSRFPISMTVWRMGNMQPCKTPRPTGPLYWTLNVPAGGSSLARRSISLDQPISGSSCISRYQSPPINPNCAVSSKSRSWGRISMSDGSSVCFRIKKPRYYKEALADKNNEICE